MLNPTSAESKIKKAIVKELEYLTSVNANSELIAKITDNGQNNINLSTSLAAIKAFFDNFSNMPIYELFSKQGMEAVIEYLQKETSSSAAIIDFLLRFKSFVFENKEIFEDVKNILTKDNVLEKIVIKERTPIEVNSVEEVKEYYVLIIIYIYNNVGE